jgi:hypothetical protein
MDQLEYDLFGARHEENKSSNLHSINLHILPATATATADDPPLPELEPGGEDDDEMLDDMVLRLDASPTTPLAAT